MIDENKLIDFIPSIAIREAIRKENIHYSDYEWYSLVYMVSSKSNEEKIKMMEYLNKNTNDINVKKYTKNYLILKKINKYKILHLLYNYLDCHLDIGEDLYIRMPFVFNKDDVLYYYPTKDIVTMYTTKDTYLKIIKNDNPKTCFDDTAMCLYGILWTSNNEMVDLSERGNHMYLFELDYLKNIYKDVYTYDNEFDKNEEDLKEYIRKEKQQWKLEEFISEQ